MESAMIILIILPFMAIWVVGFFLLFFVSFYYNYFFFAKFRPQLKKTLPEHKLNKVNLANPFSTIKIFDRKMFSLKNILQPILHPNSTELIDMLLESKLILASKNPLLISYMNKLRKLYVFYARGMSFLFLGFFIILIIFFVTANFVIIFNRN